MKRIGEAVVDHTAACSYLYQRLEQVIGYYITHIPYKVAVYVVPAVAC